uniref:Uncharacterized protein n=1 Tax=Cuerna arida TaxID=1464854 RepID=A0A1B6FGV0_9HEMI
MTKLVSSLFLILLLFLHDKVICLIQPMEEPMHDMNSTSNLEDSVKRNQQFWQDVLKKREEKDRAISNHTVLDGINVEVKTEDSLKKPEQFTKNILKVKEEKDITNNHSGIKTSRDYKKGKTDQKNENESHLTAGPVSRGKLKIPVLQPPNNYNWQETGSEKIKTTLESPTATKILLGNVESVKETNPKYSPSKENPVEEVKFRDTPNRLGEEADEGFQNDQMNVHISNITPKSDKQVKHETQVNGNDKQSVSLDTNVINQDVNNDCGETKCSGTSQERCYGNYCTYVLLFASSLYWHHTLGKF